jgi:hypothetical protein
VADKQKLVIGTTTYGKSIYIDASIDPEVCSQDDAMEILSDVIERFYQDLEEGDSDGDDTQAANSEAEIA